ncbi:MAG: hypothetical protein K2N64_04380 [Anaeroplasmataceae bacterium]|nr:hypothetical protein [Anaeroplasmataceae bacterium]
MARTTGRRNKTKFILRKELIILVFVLVAMIVTTICLSIPSESDRRLEEINTAITDYNSANSTSYSTLEKENVIRKASLKQVEGHLKSSANGSEEHPVYLYILYGSLTNATVCQYLSAIDTEARNREVKTVYLYDSAKVDNQEDKEDASFLAELENDEAIFNADILEGVQEVDLLKTPALLVYKNGELIFNSVEIEEDGSYNWTQIINKAFSL